MKKAQDRQKSYADRRRKPLEFDEGEHVFLKFTPKLGLNGPFKTKKLNLRYIGPYQISSQRGEVVYRLALPPSLSGLRDVFHVSQQQKFAPYPFQHILSNTVEVAIDLTFQS